MLSWNQIIINELKEQKLTLSTCESVTGGMIASNLVIVPGASEVFFGGLITYTNYAKNKLANVDNKIISEYGAISKQAAKAMAEGTIKKLNTDISLSITGNAGPIADENKPVGLAYMVIIVIDKVYNYEIKIEDHGRNDNRIAFTSKALEELSKILFSLKLKKD